MESFKSSGVVTKQAHVKIPEGLFEEEHGRKGFFGKVSHLYHEHPPVGWTAVDEELRPRCLPSPFGRKELPRERFTLLLRNRDVALSVGLFEKNGKNFLRNADEDELLFVHRGRGRVETSYGHLSFEKGDYLRLPKGTTYKIFVDRPSKFLKIESASEFERPERGLLGPNALYDDTAIVVPSAALGSEQHLKDYTVEVKRLGRVSRVAYSFNPLDVKGWKGTVYPSKLSIYDFCPVMSHRYHLPPSAHTTFVCHNVVVCSFTARPLEDGEEGVLKVPFYHSNVDFDEVLFYHEGHFFSRGQMEAGGLTFHPRGIHHGPHPKAVKEAHDKKRTDEFAVMIDTKNPLLPTNFFESIENKDYWKSWMEA